MEVETKTRFTLTFEIGDRSYSFNQIAETKGKALAILKSDLLAVVTEIEAPENHE